MNITIPQTINQQLSNETFNITVVNNEQLMNLCLGATEQLHILKNNIKWFLIIITAINAILFIYYVIMIVKYNKESEKNV